MEKVNQFSKEEKSLIYNRFVAPANGTTDEALHFVEYCETLGLNPLLGDVIFQKFETKYGPKTTFVATRDGLVRVAVRDENYVGPPISNVVREGDHFEFLPAEGTVVHKFGSKRGKVLGAYAVLYHKVFRPYACWVEFSEYFNANAASAGGKSYIWDKYPSAMIEKVAEVFALKRQFPIVGGLTTEEEIGLDANLPEQMEGISSSVEAPGPQQQPAKQQNECNFKQQIQEQPKPAPTETAKQSVPIPTPVPTSEVPTQAQQAVEAPATSKEQIQEQLQGQEVVIDSIEIGKSPNGMKFGKIGITKKNGQRMLVLAKGEEAVAEIKDLENGQQVRMEIVEENGFHFVQGVRPSVF
jgi:phage recombination protein Bet